MAIFVPYLLGLAFGFFLGGFCASLTGIQSALAQSIIGETEE